jgi:hypothetical protein
MKYSLLLISLFYCASTFAQTWSDDVAQISYEKCAKCHNPLGAAPFPLTTFAEASPMAAMIDAVVSQGVMPPWPPNNNYQSYAHDRSLSASEKTTILDWIANGAPEGNPANTPPPPVFQTGAVLGNGDLEIQIPTYMSKATAISDDYVCFALPSNLATDRTIRAIEVVPGNPAIVHHALVYIDPNSNGSVTDTIGGDCSSPSSPTTKFLMGYTPGSTPMVLPSSSPLKMGIPMTANSQVVITMHYPEGSYGEYDSTKVIFHFYPPGETGIREVSLLLTLENWTFSLPPNQITNVSDTYLSPGGVPINYSLISVFPHMHLLGKSMKIYGITTTSDTLKLIDIPEWDFEWQGFYYYKYLQKAEAGTVLHADAVFDNTTGNPNNPNNPPITVGPGLNTSDEMMLAFMQFMPYLAGDENYNMDSLLNLSTASIIEEEFGEGLFQIYPNPFRSELNIYSKNFTPGDVVSVFLYNSQGNLIRKLADNFVLKQQDLHLIWDGKNESGETVASGLYFLSLNVNGELSHQRIIKR